MSTKSKRTGKVVGVNGNMVSVEVTDKVKQNEVAYVRVGKEALKAEVIRVKGTSADLQVFEDTAGIKVNNEVVLEPGILVNEKDVVEYNGKVITPSVNFMYILLNKPKNTITTTSDERGRDSVLDLINEARDERLYPVGRLDRQTTGLLLLTNDGELTQRLAHPSNEIKKIYQVDLDRAVSERDLERIADGVMLEDGVADVDAVGWAEPDKKSQVILELHSGKNRVVRRIFEALGYQVDRLDRIGYAGLTKKDLPRGRYRHLTDREVIMLRHFVGRKKNLDDQTGV